MLQVPLLTVLLESVMQAKLTVKVEEMTTRKRKKKKS